MSYTEVEERIEKLTSDILVKNMREITDSDELVNKHLLTVINDEITAKLKTLGRSEKYVINIVLFEKGTAGVVTSAKCLWNTERDGFVRVEHAQKSVLCVVTVWIIELETPPTTA